MVVNIISCEFQDTPQWLPFPSAPTQYIHLVQSSFLLRAESVNVMGYGFELIQKKIIQVGLT